LICILQLRTLLFNAILHAPKPDYPMNVYGLIGYPLSHSFSKRYFSEKFEKEQIADSRYDLYELKDIDQLPSLLTNSRNLRGLNVTIPYKQAVIPYLGGIDSAASRIGAVNTIKVFADGSTKGYNTDYYGFKKSVYEWIEHRGESCASMSALVLGNGGAAKAVLTALKDLGAETRLVSRIPAEGVLTYEELTEEVTKAHRLIINTTPLGMYPQVDACPPIPYEYLTPNHFLYDLVYNPLNTLFLQKGTQQRTHTHNGLKMLELQAEKSWEIWTEEGHLWNN
jgi:shikimate dehydrogenase